MTFCAPEVEEIGLWRKNTLTAAVLDARTKGSLADLHTPGLTIEVLPSWKKRWCYRKNSRKELCRQALGRIPSRDPYYRRKGIGT